MTSGISTHFQVVPSLPLEDYQKLWGFAMFKVSHFLAVLKRPRTIFDIEGYIEELDNFELLTTQEDLNGRIWQEVHPDPTFREAAGKVYAAFKGIRAEAKSSPEVASNVDLYISIKVIHDAEDSKVLVQRWKKDLEKGGAYLAPSVREKLAVLSKAIDKEERSFLDNLRDDHRHLKLDIEELQGMPPDYMEAHPLQSDDKMHIYCKLKATEPIMDFCQVRSTRERVFRMRRNQAPNNEPVLLRLLEMRHEKTTLLGYNNWAEYQLEGMVLETPDSVNCFLAKAFQALKPQSDWEKRQIDQILWEKEGIVSQPWDLRYGATLIRAHLLPGYDHVKAREYLLVDKVFPALQTIVSGLFSLRFTLDASVVSWHPSVTVCNVYDLSKGDKLIGRIFFDIFARDGKIDGAAEYSVRPTVLGKQLAEVVLFANLSSGDDACLSLQDCKNLIHELGHCVHCLVGEPSSQKDFTEAPGLMLELLLANKSLYTFAMNKDGHGIPEVLPHQLLKADTYGRGMIDRNFLLVKAKYALDLHTKRPDSIAGVVSIMADAYAIYGSLPVSAESSRQHSFFHLAFPDYGCLYYCYLFSQALATDLFTHFAKSGNVLGKEVWQYYRETVLEKGSSRDAKDMVAEFLGRQHRLEAYGRWVGEGRQ